MHFNFDFQNCQKYVCPNLQKPSLPSKIFGYAPVGTFLMDLSKAYDSISHDLPIAILDSYTVTKNSLKLIPNYLSRRK